MSDETAGERKFTPEERKSKIDEIVHKKADTNAHIEALEKSRKDNDPGVKAHFIDVTDRQLGAAEATIGLYIYEFEYSIAIARELRDARVEAGVHGQEMEVINQMLDKMTDHWNLVMKDMKHLTTNLRSIEKIGESQFAEKKGFIGKKIGQGVDLADKSVRTLTLNKSPINLKRRREVK